MAIPSQVLNQWRRFSNTLNDKVGDIKAPSKTKNSEGDTVTGFTTVASGVSFNVAPGMGGLQSNIEAVYAERIGTRTAYFLTFASAVQMGSDYRVYETSPESRVFEVIGFPNEKVSLQVGTRVIAVEVQ